MVRRSAVIGALLLTLLVWLAAATAPADAGDGPGRRLALVIGNSRYATLPQVPNGAGDAELVADALHKAGFDVTLLVDANRGSLDAAIAPLTADARPDDQLVFYYSGQGFQLDGIDYIVPVDAAPYSQAAITTAALPLNGVLRQLQTGGRQTIAFIDASRSDPLPPSVRGDQPVNGLAPLGDGLAANLFVAFATRPGGVSEDGTGPHGPFAEALARHIADANVPIYAMMARVRTDVVAATGGAQRPVNLDTLVQPFFFNGRLAPGLTIAGAPAAVPPPTATATGGVAPAPPGPAAAGAALPATASIDLPATAPAPDLPAPGTMSRAAAATQRAQVGLLSAHLQYELKRVGCFDGVPDGHWDLGTRAALQRYFDARWSAAVTLRPARSLYTQIAAEPPGTCGARAPASGAAAPPAATTPSQADPLPGLVKHELARIGCFADTPDANWDDSARQALQRYFDARWLASSTAEPSGTLYLRLAGEPDHICAAQPPVASKTAPVRPAAPRPPAKPRARGECTTIGRQKFCT